MSNEPPELTQAAPGPVAHFLWSWEESLAQPLHEVPFGPHGDSHTEAHGSNFSWTIPLTRWTTDPGAAGLSSRGSMDMTQGL